MIEEVPFLQGVHKLFFLEITNTLTFYLQRYRNVRPLTISQKYLLVLSEDTTGPKQTLYSTDKTECSFLNNYMGGTSQS